MAWPSIVSQAFLQSGYQENPFDNVISSETDAGPPKTRRRFTGKMRTIRGSIWIEDETQYDALEAFYYGEAGEGTVYFAFNDQHGGTMNVRLVSYNFVPRGGAGYIAQLVMEEQPHA
jgi:hypothetical protein